jgi:hypothetical protein
MKICGKALVLAALAGAMVLAGGQRMAAADDPAALKADSEFVQAVTKADTTALGKLLDADFQWIDAKGQIDSRMEVLKNAPKLGISDAQAKIRRHDYGQVDVVEADSGRMHALRVWVKRPAGWRLLVYQEVQSLAAAPKPNTTPSASKECDNPCKSVGYTPKDQIERAVIESYQGLESSAINQDAEKWDAHTAEEFVAASSNSDKLLDKPTRMAELRSKNMAGLAPTPLVSAKLFHFGNAAVMVSRHVPQNGKPLEVTRVFVMRDAHWLEAVSYQTSVQNN